jgi:hypothetical protein
MKAPTPIERDADGFMKLDGFVRMPCTGPGCDVTAYVAVATEPEAVLCHACEMAQRKGAKMAAKKKTNGARATLNGAKADGDYIERHRFADKLPCTISTEDLPARSSELAKVIHARDHLLEQKRETNANFRSRVKFYDERLKELADAVEGGTELRNVDCVERFNSRTNTVELVRLDTGEVYDSRAATAEDRQEDLPGVGASEGESAEAGA